jgi:hypothetical protein
MSDTVINLLLQIPLAGVVVLVVVVFLKFLDKTFTQFMAFIKEQREANNIAIIRLADQIKSIEDALVRRMESMETILAKHDARMGRKSSKAEE